MVKKSAIEFSETMQVRMLLLCIMYGICDL